MYNQLKKFENISSIDNICEKYNQATSLEGDDPLIVNEINKRLPYLKSNIVKNMIYRMIDKSQITQQSEDLKSFYTNDLNNDQRPNTRQTTQSQILGSNMADIEYRKDKAIKKVLLDIERFMGNLKQEESEKSSDQLALKEKEDNKQSVNNIDYKQQSALLVNHIDDLNDLATYHNISKIEDRLELYGLIDNKHKKTYTQILVIQ